MPGAPLKYKMEDPSEAPKHESFERFGGAAESNDQGRIDYIFERPELMLLQKVARSQVPVLIQGETGSGKEVVARHIHYASSRAAKPLIKLNCASLPAELVESELFGYKRGAFTGAFRNKPGRFELADGGTILLDEISEISLPLQAKLLQVLQNQEFDPLGGPTVRVDVRVIAATHRELELEVLEGRFREDLYYRLNVVTIRVPALRQRREKIIPLAKYFLERHALGARIPEVTSGLRSALISYDWPGNARELENAMRKYLLLESPTALEVEIREWIARRARGLAADFPSRKGPASESCSGKADHRPHPLEDLEQTKEELERQIIGEALQDTRWNRRETAKRLGIDYKALLYRMKRLGIS